MINPINWKLSHKKLGQNQKNLVIIDNFFSVPELVLEEFNSAQFQKDNSNYPGIKAPISTTLRTNLLTNLKDPILENFNLQIAKDEILFAEVSKNSSTANPLQKIPHYDSVSNTDIAFVIYLFNDINAGTSFYKHIKTGLDTITHDNQMSYTKFLFQNEYTKLNNQTNNYHTVDETMYEKIGTVEGHFNRCVLYHSNILHSANIGQGINRHTITGFLTCA